MDRFTKTTLAVITACLLVIASDDINFPPNAQAETGAAAAEHPNSKLTAVTQDGHVYFMDGSENIYHCLNGKCTLAMEN